VAVELRLLGPVEAYRTPGASTSARASNASCWPCWPSRRTVRSRSTGWSSWPGRPRWRCSTRRWPCQRVLHEVVRVVRVADQSRASRTSAGW